MRTHRNSGVIGKVVSSTTPSVASLDERRVASPFIIATGGTISCASCYRYHTFTANGTFAVTGGGSETVCYVVVGGGGAGGAGGRSGCFFFTGGQGGSGGVVAASNVTLASSCLPVVVGSGNTTPGSNGSNSTFNGKIAYGGGAGSTWNGGSVLPGQNGGSGGAAGHADNYGCGSQHYVYSSPGSAIQPSSASGGYGGNGSSCSGNGGKANYTWVNGVVYGGSSGYGAAGASGVVIIRYKYSKLV